MGFIQAELDKDKHKFISLEQIVLYVQSLDSNKSSLADTAKFLLRRYNNDIPFIYVDDEIFCQDIADNYIKVNKNQGFKHFLEFVVTFNDFEYGITETGYHAYNQFTNLFLPIRAVWDFLFTECNLKQPHDLVAFVSNLDKSNTTATNENSNFGTPSIQINQPTLESQAAVIAELQAEITRLQSELAQQENNQSQQNSQAKRAENKQAEIIAALAIMYTKTDCNKPYEAAETIRQEWERQADKLGNSPTNDTLAKYIKQGLERLKS